MKSEIDYTLYLVTDRDLMSTPTLEDGVRAACEGGTTLVQLREKHAGHDEFARIARSVKSICDEFDVPLIVNDAVDVALEVGAAGVHVGQDDMPLAEVRRLVGPDRIVGVSASSLQEALAAQEGGADYLGVGAMTFTPTKPDAKVVSRDELNAILEAVDIPCVVIGGVNAKSIPSYAGLPLAGFAVVSAIIAAPDVCAAARELRELIARGR